jgi:hypothetical protein
VEVEVEVEVVKRQGQRVQRVHHGHQKMMISWVQD